MHNLIQKLKQFRPQSLIKLDKQAQQPLLNNDEILELLLRIQNKNKTRPHIHDISFRKIGDVRSIYRGHGMDYEESRKYQPGDDPRYMNWQLSARTGQHYMKVFREERQPGVFILIDRRNSMCFGTRQRLKITQAARVAAIAAFTAQENNFSIGGVILDNSLEWFKENKNKQSVFDFIHQASRPAPPIIPQLLQQQTQQVNINDILRTLNQVLTSGSTIYLISDFFDLDESSQPSLLELSSSHQIVAIQIADPAEVTLPKAGVTFLKSATSNSHTYIDTNSIAEQENYKTVAKNYFSEKKSLFENVAIPFHQVFTSDDDIENKIIL